MRAIFKGSEPRIFEGDALRGWQKERGRDFTGGFPILGIFRYANDFEKSGILCADISEMLSDWAFVLKKLPGECLIHHCYALSCRRILIANGSALNDFGT